MAAMAMGVTGRVQHRTNQPSITGFLFQWPTLVTLVMFPILVFMYLHLARREERDARMQFGEAYNRYAANTPAFLPKFGAKVHA